MRRIETFKAFKAFESAALLEEKIEQICELYSDAKSLEYILEEDGYDFHWKLDTPNGSYKIEGSLADMVARMMPGDSDILGAFRVGFLSKSKLCIEIWGADGTPFPECSSRYADDVRGDMQRLKSLLEDHLDYLPKGSVALVDGGWAGFYRIEISI